MRAFAKAFLFLFAALLSVSAAQAQVAYTIGLNDAGGNTLVRFDLNSPIGATVVGNFNGDVTSVDSIDFRASNGVLYGYATGDGEDVVFTIDPLTAATTIVSRSTTESNTVLLGIDFNPNVDRLRVVNVEDQNLRLNVDVAGPGPALSIDGALNYGANGPNPSIIDAAYTNNIPTPGVLPTTLFYIDSELSSLATTVAPNAGSLTTVGPLGVDASTNFVGFDIYTDSNGNNFAYAVIQPFIADVVTFSNLYSINLATGEATLVGGLSDGGIITYGLAITPIPVPEPTGAVLALTACGAVAMVRRRKR